MIGPPPTGLSAAELDRLELVSLPEEEGWEADCVYRFADSGEFVASGQEEAAAIRKAFPDAQVRMLFDELSTAESTDPEGCG